MGGGAAVVATLVSAFAPKLVSPVFVGVVALGCGVLSACAIWAVERDERLKLHALLGARPFITAEYSQNATEDERDLCDTIVFENIGDEAAVSVDFVTDPPSFGRHHVTPRLGWSPITKLSTGEKQEVSVLSFDGYLREIRKAVMACTGRAEDIRVPLVVTYSDRRERTWRSTQALLFDGYVIRIENITGRECRWTDIPKSRDDAAPT